MTVDAVKPDLNSAHVFLTGSTGFVGQAVLERLLHTYPGSRISLLVRSRGSRRGADRLRHLVRKPVFSAWREKIGADGVEVAVQDRVTIVSGGLDSIPTLPSDIDVVIHSASTVSFDAPIHQAFETNVGGAINLYNALLSSGSDPNVVHVSTCYVAGLRKGVVREARLDHDIDWHAEYDAAKATVAHIELASRQPDVLHRLMRNARSLHSKEGPQSVTKAAEEARVRWVAKQLVAAGRSRAESLGWPDVYTLTKAFAERAAEEMWGEKGHCLSIIRPSVIESALQHPFPGWIDGFKVADPLIVAYGRGQLPEFPGLPDSVLDLIPVDFVVNAILAAAASPAHRSEPRYLHVASGASNPLPFHRMFENVRQYYTENPIRRHNRHVAVPNWQFPGIRSVERRLWLDEKRTELQERAVSKLPASERTRRWQTDLSKRKVDLGILRNFTELYRAYVQTEIIFDDRNTRALNAVLPTNVRDDRGFDVRKIDWEIYLQKVHFPAISSMTRAFLQREQTTSTSTAGRRRKTLIPRRDIIAVFDLEGTVVDSNIVEQYLWVCSAGFPPSAWPGELIDLVRCLPGYLSAEHRDRGEFIRAFLRRYAGMPVNRLEHIVHNRYRDIMLRHTSADAIARIREHRAAGHRTVLVTGSIGTLAAPLADLFDDVVASTMHERNGVLTGYLAKPPLVDEARAAWLVHYAEKRDLRLDASYGYGDSQADLAWLQLLGNATAINPDRRLSHEAQRRRWQIDNWKRRGLRRNVELSASRE